MHHKMWPNALLAAAFIAIGIGIGNIPRNFRTGQSVSTAVPGIRLKRLKHTEAMFELAGNKALALKYSGGDVDFWVEWTSRGEKAMRGRNMLFPLQSEKLNGPK